MLKSFDFEHWLYCYIKYSIICKILLNEYTLIRFHSRLHNCTIDFLGFSCIEAYKIITLSELSYYSKLIVFELLLIPIPCLMKPINCKLQLLKSIFIIIKTTQNYDNTEWTPCKYSYQLLVVSFDETEIRISLVYFKDYK